MAVFCNDFKKVEEIMRDVFNGQVDRILSYIISNRLKKKKTSHFYMHSGEAWARHTPAEGLLYPSTNQANILIASLLVTRTH